MSDTTLESELRAAIGRATQARVEVGLLVQEVNRLRSELAAEVVENDAQAELIVRLRADLAARDERIARLLGYQGRYKDGANEA